MAKKPRILLVDDDVDFIDLNKAVLENNGFDVVTAFSGREATDKVSFEQPDLIVLDLMLEKHDTGFAFAKATNSFRFFAGTDGWTATRKGPCESWMIGVMSFTGS